MDVSSTAAVADMALSETPIAEIRDAPFPFNKQNADVILRSSDLMDFRVHKAILAEAFITFENMFALPQREAVSGAGSESDSCSGPFKDGLPIVEMEEDNQTLDILLRMCYPMRHPEIRDVDSLRLVLKAALRYAGGATDGGIVDIVKDRMHSIAEEKPLNIYALALRFDLMDEARFAARCSLAIPLQGLYAPELEDITGGEYYRLLQYHKACSDAVRGLTTGVFFHWLPTANNWIFLKRTDGRGPQRGAGPHHDSCAPSTVICAMSSGGVERSWETRKWWMNHLKTLQQITADTPIGKAVLGADMADAIRDTASCSVCRPLVVSELREFNRLFAEKVDEVTSRLTLNPRS